VEALAAQAADRHCAVSEGWERMRCRILVEEGIGRIVVVEVEAGIVRPLAVVQAVLVDVEGVGDLAIGLIAQRCLGLRGLGGTLLERRRS
jgi:hypothetical protein